MQAVNVIQIQILYFVQRNFIFCWNDLRDRVMTELDGHQLTLPVNWKKSKKYWSPDCPEIAFICVRLKNCMCCKQAGSSYCFPMVVFDAQPMHICIYSGLRLCAESTLTACSQHSATHNSWSQLSWRAPNHVTAVRVNNRGHVIKNPHHLPVIKAQLKGR